jgi:acyl-CoA synthetase (AMP-forming)/AMP-acid ligase II
MTVGDVPFHYASLPTYRDRVCLTADEASRTWGELAENAARVANALGDLGLKAGDRVATLLPNCLEYVEIMYGIAASGCVIVPLNPRYVEQEVAFAVDFTEASIVVTTPDLEHLVGAQRPRWVVGGRAEASYAAALECAAPTRPDVMVSDRDLYWLPFTSGTTASPKAAMVSHRALVEHWQLVQRAFEITPRDRTLIAGPFYHFAGIPLRAHWACSPAATSPSIAPSTPGGSLSPSPRDASRSPRWSPRCTP